MRKFVVWPDGSELELPPITFGEFLILAEGYWTGADDMAWSTWLRYHEFTELGDLDGINDLNGNRKELDSEGELPKFKICLDSRKSKPLKFDI